MSAQLQKHLNPKISSLPKSSTLRINEDVKDRRSKGLPVYHMGFGESPYPVPEIIKNALSEHSNLNSYPPVLGLPELRKKTLLYFSKKLGFKSEGMDCIVGPGSKDILLAAQFAIEGDVLLPTPSWVSYAPQAMIAGTKAYRIPTTSRNHHALSGGLLEETIKAARKEGLNPRKIILNYPNNPTGLGFDKETLIEIADVCRANEIIIISDEIYALVSHGMAHETIAKYYPEGTIITTGLSKHLSLGGYRIGFGFVPKRIEGLLSSMAAFASETWSCVSHPIQQTAIKCVENIPEIEDHIKLCTKAHGLTSNYVRDGLIKMGVDYPPLSGAFYMFPDFSKYGAYVKTNYGVKTSQDLAMNLWTRENLASLPGTDFGDNPETLSLRLAVPDYNGKDVLDYVLQNPEATSQNLVESVCPNLVKSINILTRYFGQS
jgi:aspartate aminotransferase